MNSLINFYTRLSELDVPMELRLLQKAVSKERPRAGGAGHFYTPKRTKQFEKMIATAASTLNRRPYTCPVSVRITVYDPIPKSYKHAQRLAAELNLISPLVGDLDNKVKAITDGLNGVAYIDDKQINELFSNRVYGDEHKIIVRIKRNGLSVGELEEWQAKNS